MPAKLKTAVVGATGYSGLELTRLLLRHPRVENPLLLSRQSEAQGTDQSGGHLSRTLGKWQLSAAAAFLGALKEQGVQLLFWQRRTKLRARWCRKRSHRDFA